MAIPQAISPGLRNARKSQTQRAQNTNQGLISSSLDMVFSYARNQESYFGSTLPSSPSFIESMEDEEAGPDYVDDIDSQSSTDIPPSDQADVFSSEDAFISHGSPPVQLPRRDDSPKLPSGRVLSPPREPHVPSHESNPKGSMISSHFLTAHPTATSYLESQHHLNIDTSKSSFAQTTFNCVNALVGVGILALPSAFAQSGWIVTTCITVFAGALTAFSARTLGYILRDNPGIHSYTDIIVAGLGQKWRLLVQALFLLEVGSLNIALVVLFSDTMNVFVPAVSPLLFKILALPILLPLVYLPLRLLSFTSLLGIISSSAIIVVVFFDGFSTLESPGSILNPAETSLAPRAIMMPVTVGLLMGCFGGHAIMPNLYRDMQDPSQYNSMVNISFVIATALYLATGMAGYLMFGDKVSDEVTRDLFKVESYVYFVNLIALFMVACNPLLKLALAAQPLIVSFRSAVLSTFTPDAPLQTQHTRRPSYGAVSASSTGHAGRVQRTGRVAYVPSNSHRMSHGVSFLLTLAQPIVLSAAVCLAILIPNFTLVLAFLGSFSTFVICVILPLIAYVSLSGAAVGHYVVPKSQVKMCYALISLSVFLAAVGTTWSFLGIGSS